MSMKCGKVAERDSNIKIYKKEDNNLLNYK